MPPLFSNPLSKFRLWLSISTWPFIPTATQSIDPSNLTHISLFDIYLFSPLSLLSSRFAQLFLPEEREEPSADDELQAKRDPEPRVAEPRRHSTRKIREDGARTNLVGRSSSGQNRRD